MKHFRLRSFFFVKLTNILCRFITSCAVFWHLNTIYSCCCSPHQVSLFHLLILCSQSQIFWSSFLSIFCLCPSHYFLWEYFLTFFSSIWIVNKHKYCKSHSIDDIIQLMVLNFMILIFFQEEVFFKEISWILKNCSLIHSLSEVIRNAEILFWNQINPDTIHPSRLFWKNSTHALNEFDHYATNISATRISLL